MYIATMFPGDLAAGPGTTLCEPMEYGMGGEGGEFQLLVLLTVGTLSRLRKARVRPELTFPSPHLITPSLVCAMYKFMCRRIR